MKSRSHLSNNQNKSESKLTKKPVRVLKKSKSAKGQWSIDEDRILIHLVEKYGERKWSHIAQMLKGRIGKQCRERWHNHLRPDIKKDIWSEEEDRVLIEAHAQVGNKWAEIVKSLPGRTENSIKNHWNATKRRQFSRRKCRTKWPKPSSLLQNYIKSLNFNKGNNMSSRTRKNGPVNKYVQNQEVQFQPEYDFESVPIFTYNEKSTVDSFMDDLSVNPPIKIDDQPCFDVGLPFDVPPLL